MSWLSKLTGVHLGNIGAPVGAAIGSIIPGVGTAIGAGLGGAIGGLGHGDSLGSSVAQGAAGAAGAGALNGIAGKVPGLQSVTDFLGGNGGKNALGLLQGANAAYNQQKSSGLANNALGTVQAEWDRRAPLRAQGQAQMLAPGQGIAARIAAVPNRNPYATPATPQLAPVGRPV